MNHTAIAGNSSLRVLQGPEPLARLLYRPPTGAAPVLAVIAVAVVLLLLVRLRRRDEPLSASQKQQAIYNGLMVLAIITVTTGLKELAAIPYLVDVAGGVIGGVLVAEGVDRLADGWGLE